MEHELRAFFNRNRKCKSIEGRKSRKHLSPNSRSRLMSKRNQTLLKPSTSPSFLYKYIYIYIYSSGKENSAFGSRKGSLGIKKMVIELLKQAKNLVLIDKVEKERKGVKNYNKIKIEKKGEKAGVRKDTSKIYQNPHSFAHFLAHVPANKM